MAVLAPYLVGLGLSQGVEAEAEASARFGADLYRHGQPSSAGPCPCRWRPSPPSASIDGVTGVVPRIVGEVRLGKEA